MLINNDEHHFQNNDRANRLGLTLIEVLIATVISILLLMSLVEAFKRIGDSITESRAALEMSNRLRSVSMLLRRDLEMATAKPIPPLGANEPLGYLKIFEGPMCDFSAKLYIESSNPDTRAGRYGDLDDILMLTACASEQWFTGKVPKYIAERRTIASYPTQADALIPTIISSKYAEIVWFTMAVAIDPTQPANFDVNGDGVLDKVQLHRRVLLIRPDLNGSNGELNLGAVTIPNAFQFCDLSMRRTSNNRVAANSIEDLMLLENRFAHVVVPLPNNASSMPLLDLDAAAANVQGSASVGNVLARSGFLNASYRLIGTGGERLGEDVVLSDCLAFDLKVFDPFVELYPVGGNSGNLRSTDMVLSPNDPGYYGAMGATAVGAGDYVDLGWYRNVAAVALNNGAALPSSGFVGFSGFRAANANGYSLSLLKSGMVSPTRWTQFCYDTWTTNYELDGAIHGEPSGSLTPSAGTVKLSSAVGSRTLADMGTNGIDDDHTGIVDDVSEFETSPPFPLPLTSMKATIRLEEPDTRQLQQTSVITEFITK